MGYTKNVLKGVSWITGVRVTTRALTFVKTLIIARVLTPNDFGLFGIATLVLTFLEIFTETGVNIFLIQEKENIDKYINTAWIVSIVRGFLIAIIIALASPLIVNFFHAPDAFTLLLLVSLVPLARGFINPSIIKFQKDLLFHKEFMYRTAIFTTETIVSIVLVLITGNVLSLIWGLLIGVLLEIVLSFYMITPRPKFAYEFPLFKKIIGYGKWITGSTVFNYFYQHGDDIAVGRMLGTSALGTYDMAYRISLIPLSDIGDVLARVTFPVYVKISDDRERLRRAFVKSLGALLLCVIPIGIILFLFPQQIISLILGPKWLTATDVLRVLAIFGVIRAVSVFSSTFFLSVNKQHIFTLVAAVGMVGLGLTIVPFIAWWGIVGAGFSALIGTTLTLPVIAYFIYKELYA